MLARVSGEMHQDETKRRMLRDWGLANMFVGLGATIVDAVCCALLDGSPDVDLFVGGGGVVCRGSEVFAVVEEQ